MVLFLRLTDDPSLRMNFNTQFVMELFLDDGVCALNNLVVAVANVINENNENISCLDKILVKEQNDQLLQSKPKLKKKVKDYFENIVVNFSDDDYIERFKMKKSTVQALINFLMDFVKPGGAIVPMDKKVHIFLWLLTSDYSFSEVGALFGLHKSSVSYIFYEVASILSEQRYHFINWPSLEEQHITRVNVNSRHTFPNCVGFIDACRLKVGKRNRKNVPETVLLQAVCDESLVFIDIHIGRIGDTRKSRVFRESQLAKELKNFVDFENHILGDSNYRLKTNLITPFTSEEVLTSEEMKFNEIHWKARTYIGHAFELLKERFKKLNHLDITKEDAIDTIIYAACALHNFVILHEGCPEIKHEAVICNDGIAIDTNVVKTAEEKREFLCNYINIINNT